MPWYRRPDGCRLFYETRGEGEPLLLLSGMGDSVSGWRRSTPRLARELRVIPCDLRGGGRSDAPDERMTMATFVADTAGLLDHLQVPAAHVYGHSLGGMVAQEAALTHPERLRSLILGATHPGPRHAVPGPEKAPKDEPWRLLY